MRNPKWDTSLGLDYSPYLRQPRRPDRVYYTPHEFPPLSNNTKLICESDLEGRGDTFQMAKKGDYLYVCHMYSSGFSVVDIKDPTAPEVIKFISTENPHVWNIKCRVLGDILIVADEWKFFEAPFPPGVGHEDMSPKEPVQAGIKIYDISKPAEPKPLSFFKTGEWCKETGGVMCHRFSYDGRYAYLSASMAGYYGRILVIVDVSDPRAPREVSRFWLKGQWIAGGERPWWPAYVDIRGTALHEAIGVGDRCYTAWFAMGGAILDISNIKRPTLISHFNYDMGGMSHTFLPIKDRQYGVFVSETRHAWMLDISDEKYPKVVAMFPLPPRELLKRGWWTTDFGPAIHNIHENYPGPDSLRSDDIIYTTCGPGGMRIYDISDPYRIEEIAYYVPGTPKVQYDPRGPSYGGVWVADIFVDDKGLIYLSDWNCGFKILEFTA